MEQTPDPPWVDDDGEVQAMPHYRFEDDARFAVIVAAVTDYLNGVVHIDTGHLADVVINALPPRSDVSVDVYAVGLLRDWRGRQRGGLRRARRGLLSNLRRREWRAIRYTFNGYLAETESPWTYRCGHGRTRRRAINDLFQHMADNVYRGERYE